MRDYNALSAEERVKHAARFGERTDLPPGARLCTVDRFCRDFFLWAPELTQFRQIAALDSARAQLWFYNDGTGVMMVERKRPAYISPEGEMVADERHISYYRFAACEHSYTSERLNQSGTWRRLTCTKCGYKTEADSSD